MILLNSHGEVHRPVIRPKNKVIASVEVYIEVIRRIVLEHDPVAEGRSLLLLILIPIVRLVALIRRLKVNLSLEVPGVFFHVVLHYGLSVRQVAGHLTAFPGLE